MTKPLESVQSLNDLPDNVAINLLEGFQNGSINTPDQARNELDRMIPQKYRNDVGESLFLLLADCTASMETGPIPTDESLHCLATKPQAGTVSEDPLLYLKDAA